MAKVKDSITVKGFSGTIGKELTFRQIGGKTFVSKYQKPPSVPATEKKLASQIKFGIATAYARKVVKDPELKALYQSAAVGGQRAFNVAMKDALNAPVVESIQTENYQGHADDLICVIAKDDFKVVRVVVSIYNDTGALIEEGDAIIQQDEEVKWIYKIQRENPGLTGSEIVAIATDLPGNSCSLSINC